MVKVAYNNCYGGFSLSDAAVRLAREISGNQRWGDCALVGEMYSDGSGPRQEFMGNSNHLSNVPRTDPVLIAVIERLGKEADGACASLAIKDIPAGVRYRIDEYDGNERVMTVDDYDWEAA